jgi:hypothetical protein
MNNYIWTYWTKPQGGKISYFDIACIGLSTALAKKHGNAKAIYTDSDGARQIEKYKIGVPIIVSLDELSGEDPRKWALAKINTYSKIDSPCIHIDYDVFLWKEQKKSSADYCLQSLEEGGNFTEIYKNTFNNFLNDAGYCPKEISPFSSKEIFAGYNMGYLQINKLDALEEYTAASLKIFSGMKTFHRHNNVFPEQYLFYCMAKSKGVDVDFLFNNELSWDEQCTTSGYTHLMEEKKKNRSSIFRRILERLKAENEDCYNAISKEIDWSIFEVGKSLVNSARDFAVSGMELASTDTYNGRLDICKACEHYDPSGYNNTGKCSICKCSTVAKPKLASAKCPIERW